MTSEDENQVLGCIAALLFIPIAVAISGWVTMYLWNGIVSPIFGLMSLSFWQAAGVDLFISYILSNSNDGGQKSPMGKIIELLVKTILTLFIGWVIIQNI